MSQGSSRIESVALASQGVLQGKLHLVQRGPSAFDSLLIEALPVESSPAWLPSRSEFVSCGVRSYATEPDIALAAVGAMHGRTSSDVHHCPGTWYYEDTNKDST